MSRFRLPSPSRSSPTQVVYDPASYVAAVKETLAEKSGLPADQRRLIFTPCAQSSSEAVATAAEEHSAEDVLSELHGWQAILLQNGRALGRLVSPQLQVTPITAAQPLQPEAAEARNAPAARSASAGAEAAASSGCGTPDAPMLSTAAVAAAGGRTCANAGPADGALDTLLEVHQLVFDRWQPVWTDYKQSRRSVVLHIPVNSSWRTANYRLQVIGKARGTGSFVLPGTYEIPGACSTAAISLHQQRCEYVRAHQRRRAILEGQDAAAPTLSKDTDLRFECGSDLNGLTAVFDVSDSPAWLKAVVLKFALVARMAQGSSFHSGSLQLPVLSKSAATDAAGSAPSAAAPQDEAARPAHEGSMPEKPAEAAEASAEASADGASQAPQHRKRVKRNHRQRMAARAQLAAQSQATGQTEADAEAEAALPLSSESSAQEAAASCSLPGAEELQQGPVFVTCATSGQGERGGQRSRGNSGGSGGGGGGDPDEGGSDGEGGDGSRAGGNGTGGAGGSDGDGDGRGRRNLHPHWDGRGKRPGNRKQEQDEAEADEAAAAAAAAASGNGTGSAAGNGTSSAAGNGPGKRAPAAPTINGSEARAAASRALSGALEVAATTGREPGLPRQSPSKPAPRPAAHLSWQASEPPQWLMMNGHAGPAMPPGRLNSDHHQQQQQQQQDSKAASPARSARAQPDGRPSPASSRRNSAPQPRLSRDDSAGQQTPQRTQPPSPAAGTGSPVRQRTPRPTPAALYVPPQLRRATAQGAQQPASQPLDAPALTGSISLDGAAPEPATAAVAPAISDSSTRTRSEPSAGDASAAGPTRPVDMPAAKTPADGSASAAARRRLQQQQTTQQQPMQQQQQPDARQRRRQPQLHAPTADKALQTEGPDTLSATALESQRQMVPASASAGTAFSSLADHPLRSSESSSLQSDSSSEPPYWSAEENSPSAASSCSLARAAAGSSLAAATDRDADWLPGGNGAQLPAEQGRASGIGGNGNGAARQPPSPRQPSSRRGSEAEVVTPTARDSGASVMGEAPGVQMSPFRLQEHQQASFGANREAPLPQAAEQQAPDGEPQQSPPPQPLPVPLSPACQPSGSATRSAPQTPVRQLQRPPGLAGQGREALPAGLLPQRPPPLLVPQPQVTVSSLGMPAGAGAAVSAADHTPPRRQVQRPPPLEHPALNGLSLSPDGTQQQRQQQQRSLPPPARSVAPGGAGQQQQQQQQQQPVSPQAVSMASGASSASQQHQHQPQQLQRSLFPPRPAMAPRSSSMQQRRPLSPPAGSSGADGFVEAPHARTPEARRDLAAVQAAAAAAIVAGTQHKQPGAQPSTPLPAAHDRVQPHDRALLAAAAAQASPSLPRAYERSLSSTSLHGMMLPAGLQQQLRLLTRPPQPAPPSTPTLLGQSAGSAATGPPAASEPLSQVEPRLNSCDAEQAPADDGHRRSVSAGPAPLVPSLPAPPATDIERLLASITPVLTEPVGPAAKPLTLGDLWAFYTEASVYGQEVFTCGGARGPAHAYFVPLLSGLQLFASAQTADVVDFPPAGGERLYACDGAARRGGSQHMRLLAQHSVGENPYARAPLHAAMAGLAERPNAGGRLDQPLAKLHPASWFAVAWYPVYRIPDAPLTARFLTFHSLALQQLPPLPQQQQQQEAAPQPRQWFAPVQGLMWDNLQQERWFDRLPDTIGGGPSPEAPTFRLQRHVTDWEVDMLRATAKLLARSTGLHVQGEHGWRACTKDDFEHGDFEFFNRRMAVVQ